MPGILQNRYDALKHRLSYEIVEPAWGWGLRVATAVLLPTILSIYTGKHDFFWAIIAAETVSIVELKGSAGMRSRLLVAAIGFTLLFTIIGSLAGLSPIVAAIVMFPIALSVGLMKNLGDWGPALGLNIYLFYLIASNHPIADWHSLLERIGYVTFGGLWAMAIGIFSFSFLPQGKPYRRTIGKIWLAIDDLAALLANDWDNRTKRSSVRALYLKEKEIRKATDESIAQFNILYSSKQIQSKTDKRLSYARRCAVMSGLQITKIADSANLLYKEDLDPLFRTQVATLLKVLEQIANRMGFYLYTLKDEEQLLLQTRLQRLEQFHIQLASMPDATRVAAQDLLLHSKRFLRLVNASIDTLTEDKERLIYSQYSLVQTLNILHPKYLVLNLKQFFNFDNLTLKYALRMAIAATLSFILGLIFTPTHSYWMPLTTIIVSQPFFGATLKKGIERTIGTVAGVILGGLLMLLPNPVITKYVLIFFGAVLMIYNLRKQYAWAAFFITLFLIGLMSNGTNVADNVIFERVIATIIGGIIAILSGFFLFPAWDKKLLPKYLSQAIEANYFYFKHLFYQQEGKQQPWTVFKIKAESSNSNAYDSLNRYLTEPKKGEKRRAAAYFTAITYNIRITRELNFYQDEIEANDAKNALARPSIIPLLNKINSLFQQTILTLQNQYNLTLDIDWTNNKNFQENLSPNESQWQCMERLYLELKALNAGLQH